MDLKSQNVVLDSALSPKICDFGVSALANEAKMITHGTAMYMAPEVARQQAVTNRALLPLLHSPAALVKILVYVLRGSHFFASHLIIIPPV